MTETARCDHPDIRYLERADAIAEFVNRGAHPMLVDLMQSQDPLDDVDVHVCADCDELLLLVVDPSFPDPDLRSVWVITDKGKGKSRRD